MLEWKQSKSGISFRNQRGQIKFVRYCLPVMSRTAQRKILRGENPIESSPRLFRLSQSSCRNSGVNIDFKYRCGGDAAGECFFIHLSLRWSITETLISGQEKEPIEQFAKHKKTLKNSLKNH
jgi:hypothetical protein